MATAAVLLGAGLVVLAAGRPWVETTVAVLSGPDVVRADGRAVAPGATALALVAAAGAVVLATSGRAVRLLVAGLLVLAGAGIAALAVAVAASPDEAIAASVARATGTAGGSGAAAAQLTPWPFLTMAGASLVTTGGLTGLVRGRRWAGPARRFERPVTAHGPAVGAVADHTGRPDAGTKVTGRAGRADADAAPSGKDQRLDAWDRLSAGEDPTD